MKFLAINHPISFFSFVASMPESSDFPAPTYSNNNVMHTPKIVIAAISSKLDAAIKVVGIPFLVP